MCQYTWDTPSTDRGTSIYGWGVPLSLWGAPISWQVEVPPIQTGIPHDLMGVPNLPTGGTLVRWGWGTPDQGVDGCTIPRKEQQRSTWWHMAGGLPFAYVQQDLLFLGTVHTWQQWYKLFMLSRMDCIVTNGPDHTWWQRQWLIYIHKKLMSTEMIGVQRFTVLNHWIYNWFFWNRTI